jgi:spore coat protein U-like protein
MSYPKLIIRAAFAAVAGLGIATTSWAAGSTPTTLNVSASVSQACTIATTAVAFGAYDPIAANATTDLSNKGTVAVKCTKGSSSAVKIVLSNGANSTHASNGTTRAMSDGGTNYLAYELYQPTATTPGVGVACPTAATGTVWGTTGAGIFTPTGTTWGTVAGAQSFNICGVVPQAQDATVGASYADTVTATVNF